MVQGTINGLGERCGNANLCSIIPDLILKMKVQTNVTKLTSLTDAVQLRGGDGEHISRPTPAIRRRSAFAHKGGMHVSAILKESRTYEHIDPTLVGNERRILISELSGTSSILAKAKELGIETEKDGGRSILEKMKELEAEGFQFEAAEASLELFIRRLKNQQTAPFKVQGFRLFMDVSTRNTISEASIRVVDSDGTVEHTAADGNGPVNALGPGVAEGPTAVLPGPRRGPPHRLQGAGHRRQGCDRGQGAGPHPLHRWEAFLDHHRRFRQHHRGVADGAARQHRVQAHEGRRERFQGVMEHPLH